MNCLRTLTLRHGMAVVVSIHQPNHEIVMMFNKVYVMAKGGHCVYSGTPYDIKPFLEECKIVCDENHVPIEQLLKVASIEEINHYKELMIVTTRETLKNQNDMIEKQMKVLQNGLQVVRKPFKVIDVCHLFSRSMAQIRAEQWKVIIAQLIFYIVFPIVITKMYKPDMGKASGCYELGQLGSCAKYVEEDDKLEQNQIFLFSILITIQFTHICYVTINCIHDTKIFVNELKNG